MVEQGTGLLVEEDIHFVTAAVEGHIPMNLKLVGTDSRGDGTDGEEQQDDTAYVKDGVPDSDEEQEDQ